MSDRDDFISLDAAVHVTIEHAGQNNSSTAVYMILSGSPQMLEDAQRRLEDAAEQNPQLKGNLKFHQTREGSRLLVMVPSGEDEYDDAIRRLVEVFAPGDVEYRFAEYTGFGDGFSNMEGASQCIEAARKNMEKFVRDALIPSTLVTQDRQSFYERMHYRSLS